jgi:hypothetical protein
MEVSGQLHAPVALSPGKRPQYALVRRLGGPQNRSSESLHLLHSDVELTVWNILETGVNRENIAFMTRAGQLSQFSDEATSWITVVRFQSRAVFFFFFSSPLPDRLCDPPTLLTKGYRGFFPPG